MSKNLLDERKKVEEKIAKLQAMDTTLQENEGLRYTLPDTLDFLTEVIPVAFLPALLGIELYAEAADQEKVPAKIAMGALVTPLAVPCIALSALLAAPIAAISLPINAAMDGVSSARTAAHNKRIKKLPKAIEKLEKRKAELDEEIKKEQGNKR